MRHAHLCGGGGVAGLVCAGPAALSDARPGSWSRETGGSDHLLQLLHHPDQHSDSVGILRGCHAAKSGMGAVALPAVCAGPTAVYIAIVGMVYQLLLRQLWNPQG